MSYSQALEEQISLLRWMNSGEFLEHERNETANKAALGLESHGETKANYDTVRVALKYADAYYWSPQIVDVLQATASSLPETTLTAEMVPSISGFWWFARSMSTGETHVRQRGFGWTSAREANDWLSILLFPLYEFNEGRRIRAGMPISWSMGASSATFIATALSSSRKRAMEDTLLHDDRVVVDQLAATVNVFLAGLLFMQQKLITSSIERVDRHTRKRLEGNYVHEPVVRVVELRRKHLHGTPSGEHEAVDWSHQWVVSGHWRQQWYPSLNANQPRWIMPYVKGPEDKPLKPPRAKVFAVVR